MRVILVGLLSAIGITTMAVAGDPIATEGGAVKNAKVVRVTKEEKALEAVKELEKFIAHKAEKSPHGIVTVAQSSASDKSVQEKLDREHEKARKGGYDREFHEAIKNNGGERLKKEWKDNCNSKPLNKKELNCS